MRTVGIIGFGNMGRSIAEKIKSGYAVIVFDKDFSKTGGVSGIRLAENIPQLLEQSHTILLAVKPQDFEALLREIKDFVKAKTVISIAAGITTGYVESILAGAAVVRAMPNIGARIGKSVTCVCKGKLATEKELEEAQDLFSRIGKVRQLREEMMNAATAICGSGPGYYFYALEKRSQEYKDDPRKFREDFIKGLTEAARELGFDEETSGFLANWTVVYSDLLPQETRLAPAELKKQVASRGGTTEAALEVLHNGGSLTQAARAALRRAEELSKKE